MDFVVRLVIQQIHDKSYEWSLTFAVPFILNSAEFTNVGPIRYKYGAGAPSLTSFRFHFAQFSEALLRLYIDRQ